MKQTTLSGESSWFALPAIPKPAPTVTDGEQTAKATAKSSAASNATSHEKCSGSSQTHQPFTLVPIYAPPAPTPNSPCKPQPNNSTHGPSGSHESNEDSSTTTNSPADTTTGYKPKKPLDTNRSISNGSTGPSTAAQTPTSAMVGRGPCSIRPHERRSSGYDVSLHFSAI